MSLYSVFIKQSRLRPSLLAVALLASLTSGWMLGCSGKSVEDGDPGTMYKEAEEEIKSDHYQLAADKLHAIKNKYPYSKYSVDAQLRLADVYFMQESYAEAAASYESFRDLHPKHEKVPYAMFRIAKSYFNDIPDPISRDMTPAQKSVDAYSAFLKRFPEAPEVGEAQKDLNSARARLAEKELYIAEFYYKRDFYDSARPRYQKILDLYPETDSAKPAKEKLDRIAEIKKKEEARLDARK